MTIKHICSHLHVKWFLCCATIAMADSWIAPAMYSSKVRDWVDRCKSIASSGVDVSTADRSIAPIHQQIISIDSKVTRFPWCASNAISGSDSTRAGDGLRMSIYYDIKKCIKCIGEDAKCAAIKTVTRISNQAEDNEQISYLCDCSWRFSSFRARCGGFCHIATAADSPIN